MNAHLEWLLSSAQESKRDTVARAAGMAEVSPMVVAENDDELVLVSCGPTKSEPWQTAAAVAQVAADLMRASGVGLVIESLTKTVRVADYEQAPDRDPLHEEFMFDPMSTVRQCLVAFWSEHGRVEGASIEYHYDDGAVLVFAEPRSFTSSPQAANDPISLAGFLGTLTGEAPRMRALVDRETFASGLRSAGHAVEFVERA